MSRASPLDELRSQLRAATMRVPFRVVNGSTQAAQQWKERATKAMKIANGGRATEAEMRQLLGQLQ